MQMTFLQYEMRMQTTFSNLVKEVYTRVQYKLRIYFILTVVCAALDLLGFMIQLVRFAELDGDEKSDVLLIVTCYIFLIIDWYYVCWVRNLQVNLPPKYKEHATKAMIGFGHNLQRELNVNTIKARDMMKAGKRKAGQGAKKVAGLYKQKKD